MNNHEVVELSIPLKGSIMAVSEHDRFPIVSVIVPVYNSSEFLRECVDSVLAQTMGDFEVVCIDDGSTDNSLEILQEYAREDSRIRVYSQRNSGLGAARNAGMSHVQGKYMFFLDSDDWVVPDLLERCIQEMDRVNLDLLFFGGETFFDTDELEARHAKASSYYVRENEYSECSTGCELFRALRINHEYRSSACMQVIRTDFIKLTNTRFPEGVLSEDEVYTLRVLLNSQRAGCISDCLYRRRVREGSLITGPNHQQRVSGLLIALQYVWETLSKSERNFSCQLTLTKYAWTCWGAIVRLLLQRPRVATSFPVLLQTCSVMGRGYIRYLTHGIITIGK